MAVPTRALGFRADLAGGWQARCAFPQAGASRSSHGLAAALPLLHKPLAKPAPPTYAAAHCRAAQDSRVARRRCAAELAAAAGEAAFTPVAGSTSGGSTAGAKRAVAAATAAAQHAGDGDAGPGPLLPGLVHRAHLHGRSALHPHLLECDNLRRRGQLPGLSVQVRARTASLPLAAPGYPGRRAALARIPAWCYATPPYLATAPCRHPAPALPTTQPLDSLPLHCSCFAPSAHPLAASRCRRWHAHAALAAGTSCRKCCAQPPPACGSAALHGLSPRARRRQTLLPVGSMSSHLHLTCSAPQAQHTSLDPLLHSSAIARQTGCCNAPTGVSRAPQCVEGMARRCHQALKGLQPL